MNWLTHQRVRACAAVGLVLFLLLDWLPWMIQDRLAPGGKQQAEWIFWFQTVSGNWTPRPRPGWITDRLFAFSAVIATLMNNSLYIAIFAVIMHLVAERRRRMTFREALDVFEIAARAEIIRRMEMSPPTSLQEAAARIDEGLAEGRKAALPIIRAVGGTDALAAWEAAQERHLG